MSTFVIRCFAIGSVFAASPAVAVEVNFDAYDPASGVVVQTNAASWNALDVGWQAREDSYSMDFETGRVAPLIQQTWVVPKDRRKDPFLCIVELDPVLYLTIGTRERPRGGAPQWPEHVFFDNPAKRPHQTFRSKLELKSIDVVSCGSRTTIRIGELTCGSFRGAWEFTFFAGSPLVKIEAVMSTDAPNAAVVYDLGLVGLDGSRTGLYWHEPHGAEQRTKVDAAAPDTPTKVRGRTLIADSPEGGTLAVFPPPHQFYFPRDYTDNLADVWYGANHAGLGDKFGIGIRQAPTGGGNWVPWCNAPPGTQQRFGMFVHLSSGDAPAAYDDVLRYTHHDRFEKLPNQTTFTSHYHMAVAEQAMRRSPAERETAIPEFVDVFRDMGVEIVHLGEFHGDGHPKDPGPLRLPEMETMFRECRRLSGDELLFIPGEEINEWLGKDDVPGRHPGHWMSLFPRPVAWMQRHEEGQPFVVDDPKLGKVYRVGNRDEMRKLIEAEGALVWSAHPRIKASSWAPDAFQDEDYFRDAGWLGAAFKHMPADLSHDRLGKRCLDLLDDMSNWGAKKYLPGEVDVFKIDRSHELYGHMNVNYLRLDRVPKYDDGWQPVLDVLQRGAFFTTTGEVLIQAFTVGGKQSGESLPAAAAAEAELRVELSWTFPPEFAEVISGDGREVFRERIDLTGEKEFGTKTITLRPKLAGRRWVRFEAWDAAVNGAYTQPIWIDE